MRSFSIIIAFAIFTPFFYAQEYTKSLNADSIESSNNYQKNVVTLEKAVKGGRENNQNLLALQVLLVDNYIHLSQFEKATQLCQQEIIIANKNKSFFNEATLYLALAKCYYHLNQVDKFLQYNNESLKIAKEHQYLDLLTKCNHNLGVKALEIDQNYQLAQTYFLRAIEYGKRSPITKQHNLGRQYRLLATTYDILGEYSKADSLFEITIAIYREYKDSAGLATALTFQARLFGSMKQYEKAVKLSKEAILISKLIKNDLNTQTALSIYENIQVNAGNYKEAYLAAKEILNIQIAMERSDLKNEIAETEAKFKVAELKNKQELSELTNKQTKQKYLFVFMIVFLITIFLIIFYYQYKIGKKEQALKIKNLEEIYIAQEKERTRIAQDLHDNMGAHTTSILAQIDRLSNKDTNANFDQLRSDAENIMAMLRETIWILKTKNISVNDFYDLIKNYANKQLKQKLNINVCYNGSIDDDKLLSPSVTLNLYRILQETIQNIIKHASATSVEFIFTLEPKLTITVIDNGKGFDMETKKNNSGLENMKFRANEICYTLTVSSAQNLGTKIYLGEKI